MKIIVCHPAQQHSYRLATALKRGKMLGAYITTVYYKPRSFTRLISTILKGKFKKKAEGRHTSELDDKEVIQFCEIEGLLKLLALNVPFFSHFYNKLKYNTADRFAKKVAQYAIDHRVDAVVTYDDCSPLLFETLQEKAPHILRILDVSAANLIYMRQIYDKDMDLSPDFAMRLRKEMSRCWNPTILDRAKREILSSQKFLVPSNFVSTSLKYSGVKENQMLYCPYGVDASQFSQKNYEDVKNMNDRPLRFIYVGGVKELKGISYLLKAFMNIPQDKAELTIVGAYSPQDKDIQPYLRRVHFTGMVLHSEVPNLLKAADVFVFPSLGDGFGLAVLEAAAVGLPLIISENAGVTDVIRNNKEGLVIPIQSSKAIEDAVTWFVNHPEAICPMGMAARAKALEYTWERYYKTAAEQIRRSLHD
ncbi:glycosyltransferase [Megasphaera sp. AM44-1BH]|uniref:glycosyltransferase family 4 protein n=1 Tax=Megasphaera sp. AM44-1BH TaxID=2292358 RepID=UPI000E52F866|nr:glycosyltransferase family 4 protein [Megasphaera sp. AM44-1BH]RHA09994.1 glycosyltransferase [Megasphaera sp. AM44-1BH]